MAAITPTTQTPTSHESPLPQQQQSPANTAGSPERANKRQKVTRACDNCKSRKRRCTGELPCSACHSNGSRCTYLASYTRGRLVQPQAASHPDNAGTVFTTPAISQIQYESTLGTPYQAYQPDYNVKPSRAASPEGGSTFAGQYLGPTSPWSFLRRAWKRFEEDGTNINTAPSEEPAQSGAIFTYGDRQAAHVQLDKFHLASRQTTSMLLQHYFDLAMPTYRFLHRGTVSQWLEAYHEAEESQRESSQRFPGREAVVLMVLATARLFNVDDRKEILDPDERSWVDSEQLFQMSQSKLQLETGRARLESVQARIGSCLYLLHTSRPNQAWFLFGTTVQLAFSLGLHRSDNWKGDAVARECRKRVFWACSTLDTYLSVIKGVPPLISLDEVDQRLPDAIDDEDLTPTGITSGQLRGDSVIKASIYHAQITRIVKKAAREQYSAERKKGSQKLETAARLNAETDAWHASLPVVLSGAIHPSSLIAIFRRQITVLQLAHAHAQMLINRPSLLVESSQSALRESQVQTCLAAAKSTLDTILAASFSKHIFQAFWHTQFVSFNALSIVYVWLIQRKNGRLPPLTASFQEEELLHLAQTVQQHLVAATEANAPSLRYNIVLEEMQQEVRRIMTQPAQRPHSNVLSEEQTTGAHGMVDATDVAGVNRVLESVGAGAIDPLMETYSVDFPLDPDLWLTLDSFPFSDFGQIE